MAEREAPPGGERRPNRTGAALWEGCEAVASLFHVPSTAREPGLLIETRWVCSGRRSVSAVHSLSVLPQEGREGPRARGSGVWGGSSLGLGESPSFPSPYSPGYWPGNFPINRGGWWWAGGQRRTSLPLRLGWAILDLGPPPHPHSEAQWQMPSRG